MGGFMPRDAPRVAESPLWGVLLVLAEIAERVGRQQGKEHVPAPVNGTASNGSHEPVDGPLRTEGGCTSTSPSGAQPDLVVRPTTPTAGGAERLGDGDGPCRVADGRRREVA